MIRVLPKRIFEKIAAGEVVTAPFAVVKELVENSVDAGATSVSVYIEDGGKKLIRVSDNGHGISADEIALTVAPHATSKIADGDDLDNILTLGFRGEALASIAAVSKLTLISKIDASVEGAQLYAAGGDDPLVSKAGAPKGTSVLVEDLFFNVPARRKFLKSDRTETSAIIDFVSRMAIAWPNTRFYMGHNNTDDFSTLGNGDTLNAISNTAGSDISAGLLTVNVIDKGMKLTAYISPPDIDRKTRKNQYFFVNGRSISDSVLSEAVANAYKGFIFEGRFPVAYIFLEIDPKKTDVNVHPSKTQIRFSDKNEVRDFVENAVEEALRENGSAAKIRSAAQAVRAKRDEKAFYSIKSDVTSGQNLISESDAGISAADIYSNVAAIHAENDDTPVKTVKITDLWDENTDNAKIMVNEGGKPGDGENVSPHSLDASVAVNEGFIEEAVVPEYVDRIFGLYLLAKSADKFYIIDQHAAHERINYEQLIAQLKDNDKLTQGLLAPLIVTVPASAKPYANDWFEWLGKLGFEAEEFGAGSFSIRAFPAFLSYEEAESFLGDIIENAGSAPPENMRAVDRLISRACRTSVKLNDSLSPEASQELIDRLFRCENPLTCPHGRPVFIAMTSGELDRTFKRNG